MKRGNSLQTSLRERLERAPGRRALAFIDARGRFAWRSLEQVHDSAAAYGAAFAEHGLGPGDVCILALPSTETCAELLLGTLLLGAVPLLVAPPVLPGREAVLTAVIRQMARKTKARLLVVPATRALSFDGLGRTRLVVRDTELSPVAGARLPVLAPAEDAVAILQLTSGTTGFPRLCVWTHRAVAAALEGMALAMRLGEDDACLNWTPLYHDMGLANNFLLCLTRGVPLAMLSPTDFVQKPALWLRGLWETRSTITWSPNFGFALTIRKVRDDEIQGVRLGHVRAFWNAAERIHAETMIAFYQRFSALGLRFDALKTNYGCAENVGGASFSDPAAPFPVEQVDQRLLREKGLAGPRPGAGIQDDTVSVVGVGRPCPGVRIRILSPAGRPLPDGHVGEVALDTPSRMSGYLGRSRDTRRALHGALLRTGDLGYLRGDELFWVGRVRERITVRGQKLDPSDFERVLHRLPGVRPGCFAAFGVDDPKRGTQRVVLAVELHDPTVDPDRVAVVIRGEVHRQLGVTVDDLLLVPPGTLTKTSSGKRRHRVFRELYLTGELHASAIPRET